MASGDAAPSGQRRRGVSGVSRPELAGIFAEPLCHGFRQDTTEASSVLSSEATKLAAQGNRDLASGVLFLNLSECRGHGPPVSSSVPILHIVRIPLAF